MFLAYVEMNRLEKVQHTRVLIFASFFTFCSITRSTSRQEPSLLRQVWTIVDYDSP